MDRYIFLETPSMVSKPTNIKENTRKNWIRMECILQTANDINKNKRRYPKKILEDGIKSVEKRIKEGSLLGELDHPVDTKAGRQVVVLFKEAAHRILDVYWDGNKLCGLIETLNTPNGNILKNIALQGVPVGWSFRGMGDVSQMNENGQNVLEVKGPLFVITWDSVSNPSHAIAKTFKINESSLEGLRKEASDTILHESSGITQCKDMVCTAEGVCYLPEQFDEFVDKKIITLINKYSI